jgi:Tol biopolymer transport system component/predicted Ser/Thr protein kinase
MEPERWRRIEDLYHSALEVAEDQRATFVKQACAGDDALREEVESLLAYQKPAQDFIEAPAFEMAARLMAQDKASSPEGDPVFVGRTISHYRVLEKLGSGGMGVVYKAEDARLHRSVALKFLPDEVARDPQALARFQREAQAASALNHPNICTIYEISEQDGQAFIVMEFIAGKTLDQLIGRKGLKLKVTLKYGTQIASALAAAHAAGIIHRDLKPANVMVTDNGLVKILDFGVAKLVEPTGELASTATTLRPQTEEGAIVGTVAYMSPEQAQGTKVDARSDIFSFGSVLYEMITGQHAFHGETKLSTLSAILDKEPRPVSAIAKEAPPELEKLIARCLRKDPERRVQHMGDLKIALEELKEESESDKLAALAPPGGRAPARGWHWAAVAKLRGRLLPWVALAGLVAAMGLRETSRPRVASENPLANATFTRLTNFEGAEHAAAVSPDGRWVAFRADREGPFDVWLDQVGTGRFLNLTQGKVDEEPYPMRTLGFSGDGSEIWLFGPPDRRVRLVPLMGGTPRVFLGEGVIEAAWSADGARLVYHTAEDGDPMFVADRSGVSPRRIFIGPSAGWHNHFPTWSLDGRWIYFVSYFGTAKEMDLWRIAATGGVPERLTQHKSDVGYPAPIDNRTVLYVARDQDGSGPWLWALDVERKLTRRASFGLEKYTSVAASTDGRRLVASVANPSASLWSVSILDRPAEEHDIKRFPLPSVNAMAPRFGAASLFYLSSRGAGDGLWRYQDGQALEIWKGADGALLEPPAVSPNGQRVTIVLRQSGKLRLHVVSADGAEIQSIADALDVEGTACWSPDGKWIVTGGNDAAGAGLFKIPVESGAPVRLVAGRALDPVWSPDGSLIVYAGPEVAGDKPLLAVSPDGTKVELPAIRVSAWGERVRFLPNGKALVYMQRGLPAQDFALLDLVTKKTRQLTHLHNSAAMRTFDITPDGRSIVFDRLRENSDIVLIDLPRKQGP